MAAFRSIAVDAAESTLSGTVRPSGFKPTGPRPGSAVASDYFVVFHDTNGAAMIGGSATLAWYGVSFDGAVLMTASIGAAVVTADHVTRKIEVGEGVYFWPRVTAMTPPTVAAKSIRVNVGGDDDGTWSIGVDAETPVEFEAVDATVTEIAAGLVAAFAGHPTADAEVAQGGLALIVTYQTAGEDFELTLVAPADRLTQSEETPVVAVAATLRIYTAAAVASGIDTAAIAAAVAADLTIPTAAENAAAVAASEAMATTIETAAALALDGKMADIAAALGAAWGTVQRLTAQYVNTAGVLIAAPGAGFKIEILTWDVSTFALAGNFQWTSGATANIDTGPEVQSRTLSDNSSPHGRAVSPEHPLYSLAENQNFGVAVDSEIVVDVQYRIVAA